MRQTKSRHQVSPESSGDGSSSKGNARESSQQSEPAQNANRSSAPVPFEPNVLGPLANELNGYAQLSRSWDGRGAEPFDLSLIFEVLRLSESVLDQCRRHDSKATRPVSRPHPDGSIEVEFIRPERMLSLRLHPGLVLDVQRKGPGCPSEILVYTAGVTLAVEQAAAWLAGADS